MGGYVLWEDMCYGRTYLTGGHVLMEEMSYWRIYLTGGYVHNVQTYD